MPAPIRRLIPSVAMTPIATPTLASGRPVVAKYTASYGNNIAVTQGSGHVRVFPDPDPIWNGTIWTTQPPDFPAGSVFLRWSARGLPNYPTGTTEYYLGKQDAFDGSTAGNWGQNWYPDGVVSTDPFSIPWTSAYPFKPRVASYTHHGRDGTKVVTPKAVHLFAHRVEHMWADFGTLLTYPFTFMLCCVFTRFASPKTVQCVLDSGRDPTTGTPSIPIPTRQAWQRHGVPARYVLGQESGANKLPYRVGLQVHPKRVMGFDDPTPTTKMAKVPFAYTLRPKVLYGVYNGNNSVFGVFGNSKKYPTAHVQRTVKLAPMSALGTNPFRYVVMGRGTGAIDTARAACMVIFEIRVWSGPLTRAQLEAQHDQISSTWRFVEHT